MFDITLAINKYEMIAGNLPVLKKGRARGFTLISKRTAPRARETKGAKGVKMTVNEAFKEVYKPDALKKLSETNKQIIDCPNAMTIVELTANEPGVMFIDKVANLVAVMAGAFEAGMIFEKSHWRIKEHELRMQIERELKEFPRVEGG